MTGLLDKMLIPADITSTPLAIQSFLSLLTGTPTQLLFLLSVAGYWYLIGRWLDRRGTAKSQPKFRRGRVWAATWRLLVLASGLSALLYSLYLHKRVLSFFDTLEIAMVQTWAVFFIGVPVSGLGRRLLMSREHEKLTEAVSPVRQPISNFRLFVMVLGVFAALLILGVLTGPTGPK